MAPKSETASINSTSVNPALSRKGGVNGLRGARGCEIIMAGGGYGPSTTGRYVVACTARWGLVTESTVSASGPPTSGVAVSSHVIVPEGVLMLPPVDAPVATTSGTRAS